MGSARLCVSLRIFPAKDDNLRSQPDCLPRHLPRLLRVNVIMPRAGDRIYATTPLARIKEIAATRVHYGYRRVHVMLQREGWKDNHKRVHP
ncbi:hypothetical protein LMG10661_03867 [Ralstonia syzygii subsp. syzygii]|nr:hypothetical protein LMG10661_03867 [Ralstonia syzygii subsp. syzygii]